MIGPFFPIVIDDFLKENRIGKCPISYLFHRLLLFNFINNFIQNAASHYSPYKNPLQIIFYFLSLQSVFSDE